MICTGSLPVPEPYSGPGHVAAVYASNDGNTWHLVTSKKQARKYRIVTCHYPKEILASGKMAEVTPVWLKELLTERKATA